MSVSSLGVNKASGVISSILLTLRTFSFFLQELCENFPDLSVLGVFDKSLTAVSAFADVLEHCYDV